VSADGRYLWLLYIVQQEPTNSLNTIKLNGEDMGSLSWVTYYVGQWGWQSAPPSQASTDIPGLESCYPGRVLVWVKIDLTAAASPGVPTLTANVSGLNPTDVRGTGSAWGDTNPANVAAYLLTNAEVGAGIPRGSLDTASWSRFADWCDETMSDGSTRWQFNGLVSDQSAWDAALDVLRHGFARPLWYGGKLYCVASMPQRCYDPADIHDLPANAWVSVPVPSVVPAAQRPTEVQVDYYLAATQETVSLTHPLVTANLADARGAHVTLRGCPAASQATRWADQYGRILREESLAWSGRIGPVGSSILPGDLVNAEDPVTNGVHLMRVIEMADRADGTYDVTLQLYSETAMSDLTADDDSALPDGGVTWGTDPPAAPTGLTLTSEAWTMTDGVTQAVLKVAWTASTGRPPADRYEVELDGKLVTTTRSTTVYVPINKYGSSIIVSVYAVGANSARSAALSGVKTVSLPSAKVTGIQGTPVASANQQAYDTLRYNNSSGQWEPAGENYQIGYKLLTIPNGGSSTSMLMQVGNTALGAVACVAGLTPQAVSVSVTSGAITVYRSGTSGSLDVWLIYAYDGDAPITYRQVT